MNDEDLSLDLVGVLLLLLPLGLSGCCLFGDFEAGLLDVAVYPYLSSFF